MPVWKKALAVMLSLVVALGLLLFVAGLAYEINSHGALNSPNAASAAPEAGLVGYAFLAKPLTDATVNVYELKSDGQTGALLASTTTDANGYYTVSAASGLPSSSSLLVTTAGGSSVDEISGKPLASASGDSLKTIVAPEAAYALLTPLTTLAASRAMSLIKAGNSIESSVAVSYGAIARQYNMETLTAIVPAVVSDPQSVKVSGITARQMGLILAGLDEEAATLGVTDFGIVNALAQDISDGDFDGKEGATQITIGDPVPLPPDAATLKLAEAISKINASHLSIPLITQQPPISSLGPGVLFVSSPGLPLFVDGEAASALIGSGGGTAPIKCILKSGSIMPAEFGLTTTCSVQYSGMPVLGTSVGRIGDLFTVQMSDSSKPPQSVSFDLRISVVAKPPAITTKDGVCPQVKQPCSLTIATASGGTEPYSFTGEFGFGSKPLGMFIQMDGTLSGSPATAGKYTFNVCVVDLVGSEKCALVTVVVQDTPPAQPAAGAYYYHLLVDGSDPLVGGPYPDLPTCQAHQALFGSVGRFWCSKSSNPSDTPSPSDTPATSVTWYLHFNCGGDASCIQTPGNGNNTGIFATFSDSGFAPGGNQGVCEQGRIPFDNLGEAQTSWCSTNSDPGEIGPSSPSDTSATSAFDGTYKGSMTETGTNASGQAIKGSALVALSVSGKTITVTAPLSAAGSVDDGGAATFTLSDSGGSCQYSGSFTTSGGVKSASGTMSCALSGGGTTSGTWSVTAK